MKKTLLTLVLLVLGTAATFAGQRHSDLRISVHQDQFFLLNLDGYRFFRPADRVILTDLQPGRHHLEVYSACRRQLLYRGPIHVQAGSQIDARIDHRGRFVVTHVKPRNRRSGIGPVGPGTLVLNAGAGSVPVVPAALPPQACPLPGPAPAPCASPAPPTGFYTGYAALPNLMQPIAPAAFQSLLRTLEAQPFEDNRVLIARDALRRHGFRTEQLRAVLLTLHFESSRLELAKVGYASLIDPHQVHLLTDVFRFASSTADFYASISA